MTVSASERTRDADERAYAEIRAAERTVDVDHLGPVAAIRRLAEVTFDHHEAHPAFIKLVGVENAQQAHHMSHVARLVDLNSPAFIADTMQYRSLWSIQMWCENIGTLMASSVAPENDRFRTMTLCTAFAGGDVTSSSTGTPMLSPPPWTRAVAPIPMMVLSDDTLYMPSLLPVGNVIVPCTRTTRRPVPAIAAMSRWRWDGDGRAAGTTGGSVLPQGVQGGEADRRAVGGHRRGCVESQVRRRQGKRGGGEPGQDSFS